MNRKGFILNKQDQNYEYLEFKECHTLRFLYTLFYNQNLIMGIIETEFFSMPCKNKYWLCFH
jgi:hypothetical protein